MTCSPALRACSLALALALGPCGGAGAADAAPDLSLEELLQADVQTASRKSQRLQDVAAAVFVISREDILRAGVNSLPEALRLAPGLQVARLSNSRWSISARGFGSRYANKLLVLMDGRSLYSPLFAGVLWELHDTLLDDIERIEVIRGPGAALWGANAVNGVINIITRRARDTLGSLVVATAGSEEPGTVAVRHGLALGPGELRGWVQGLRRSASRVPDDGRDGNDDWRALRLGLRGDWTLDGGRRLSVSGSAQRIRTGDRWDLPSLDAADGQTLTDAPERDQNAHLLARHDWLHADGSHSALQGWLEVSQIALAQIATERRQTLDLDFQHRPRLEGAHDLVWGLSLRQSNDRIETGRTMQFDPSSRRWRLLSGFLQDEISLQPQRWRLTLGARLEHASHSGLALQPHARLAWTPDAQHTLWMSASRAVRNLSRAERDATLDLAVVPASGSMPPVLIRSGQSGDDPAQAERLVALEAGWRQQVSPVLWLDVAAYANRYSRLRGIHLGPVQSQALPRPHLVQLLWPDNRLQGRGLGLELVLDWQPSRAWRLQAHYSHLALDVDAADPDPVAESAARALRQGAPRHQASLRVSLTPGGGHAFDAWLRHTGTQGDRRFDDRDLPAYQNLDLRWAWRTPAGPTLSITGQNLLRRHQVEAVPDLLPSQTLAVRRAAVARLHWPF